MKKSNPDGGVIGHAIGGTRMTYVGLRGISVYWPEDRMDTRILLETDQIDPKGFEKIGVRSVPVAAPDETPTNMAIKAGRNLLQSLQIHPDEIDLLVYVGATLPDFLIWSPASKVCFELGCKKAIGFEMSLGCGGIQAAFQALKGMMLTSQTWKRALIVSAEIWGPFTKNRYGAGLIFGDSAAAVLLEKGDDVPYRILEFDGFTDGTYHSLGHLSSGTPFSARLLKSLPPIEENLYTIIDGSTIGQLNKTNIVNYQQVAERVLDKSGWKKQDLAGMIFPSGRFDLMRKLSSIFDIEPNRTNMPFLPHQGDLGSPSLLVDLHNSMSQWSLQKGDKLLVLSAGVGITWMGLTLEV